MRFRFRLASVAWCQYATNRDGLLSYFRLSNTLLPHYRYVYSLDNRRAFYYTIAAVAHVFEYNQRPLAGLALLGKFTFRSTNLLATISSRDFRVNNFMRPASLFRRVLRLNGCLELLLSFEGLLLAAQS